MGSLHTGWHNPYLYDGHYGTRYDSETGLYWLSVRAYDPTLGRFISRDPLGRAPLFFDASQPYAYAGNNPLRNTDPSGKMPGGAFVEGDAFWTPSMAPSRVQELLSSVEPTHITTRSTRCDPDDPQTENCRQWTKRANNLRTAQLKQINANGQVFVAGAVLVTVLGLYIAYKAKFKLIEKIEIIIDVVLGHQHANSCHREVCLR